MTTPAGASARGGTLAAAFATGHNHFDLIRLLAAFLVLAGHSWVLTGRPGDEPFAKLLGHATDGGGLAVAVFFVLSGFLIARSVGRQSPAAYLRARALRLYPAFLVAALAQTLLLGAAVTAVPLLAYLADPAPWLALARALLFSVPLGLPGVFTDNPVPLVVNGSLWTLRVEALCYLGLLALAMAGLLRRGWILMPLGVAWALLGATEAARSGLLPQAMASLRIVSIVDCVLDFMMGATLWAYAGAVPRRFWLAAAGGAVFALAAGTRCGPAALHLVLPYIVLSLGLSGRMPRPAVDVSYGTYLYAFPIQQSLVMAVPGLGPLGLAALTAPIALCLGWASRRWVEAPALRLR